jgi:stringent starvation protein B
MHEWMTDNGQTPHLLVQADAPGLEVPAGFARDGKVVLNVSWQATQGLKLGNDLIEFSARFGGVPHQVRVPTVAVLGIYSRETGQGMLFQEEGDTSPPDGAPPEAPSPGAGPGPGKPKLRVVK